MRSRGVVGLRRLHSLRHVLSIHHFGSRPNHPESESNVKISIEKYKAARKREKDPTDIKSFLGDTTSVEVAFEVGCESN